MFYLIDRPNHLYLKILLAHLFELANHINLHFTIFFQLIMFFVLTLFSFFPFYIISLSNIHKPALCCKERLAFEYSREAEQERDEQQFFLIAGLAVKNFRPYLIAIVLNDLFKRIDRFGALLELAEERGVGLVLGLFLVEEGGDPLAGVLVDLAGVEGERPVARHHRVADLSDVGHAEAQAGQQLVRQVLLQPTVLRLLVHQLLPEPANLKQRVAMPPRERRQVLLLDLDVQLCQFVDQPDCPPVAAVPAQPQQFPVELNQHGLVLLQDLLQLLQQDRFHGVLLFLLEPCDLLCDASLVLFKAPLHGVVLRPGLPIVARVNALPATGAGRRLGQELADHLLADLQAQLLDSLERDFKTTDLFKQFSLLDP
jgi:hypothetical protein